MIDATPSLKAAEGLTGPEVVHYLSDRGWVARPSKVDGVSIVSLDSMGSDPPLELIMPVKRGFTDETRRIADALRTLAQLAGTSELLVADEIRRSRGIDGKDGRREPLSGFYED